MKIYNILKEIIKEQEEEPKNGFHYEYSGDRKWGKIHYSDGVPDGYAEYYGYQGGEEEPYVRLSGFYDNGVKVGKWRNLHPDQNNIEYMVYKNGEPEKSETYDSTLSKPIEKVFYKPGGKNEPEKVYKYNDEGRLSKATYIDSGKEKTYDYYENGNLENEYIYDNVNHANYIQKKYHENGNISHIRTFVNNQVNGKFSSFDENGKIKQTGTYEDGKLNGIVRYYSDGKLRTKMEWKNNVIDGMVEDYFDGKLTDKGIYKNGKQDGIWLQYHDGDLYSKTTYKNGIRNGEFIHYISGRIFEKGNYVNGKRDGVWEEYWSKGSITTKEYINGELISN